MWPLESVTGCLPLREKTHIKGAVRGDAPNIDPAPAPSFIMHFVLLFVETEVKYFILEWKTGFQH